MVSLFISFTLDPMLSAYWGDPVGYAHAAEAGASARCCARFNDWFDHQADRYGNVIAWALHHRKWMAAIAVRQLRRRARAAGRRSAARASCRRPTTARSRSTCARRRRPASNTPR